MRKVRKNLHDTIQSVSAVPPALVRFPASPRFRIDLVQHLDEK